MDKEKKIKVEQIEDLEIQKLKLKKEMSNDTKINKKTRND